MNGLCSEPLSWEKTAQLIQEGTVESLGQLGRSESQLSVYRKFMAGVREDYASVGDFVKILVFEAAVHMKDGKKHAVDPEQSKNGDGALWRLNDFPYNFEDGVQHWLLWSTREIPAPRIQELMDSKFPEAAWDRLYFLNPPALQSVLAVWHCHVLVRPKNPEAAPQ